MRKVSLNIIENDETPGSKRVNSAGNDLMYNLVKGLKSNIDLATGPPGNDATVTKQAVETVLTGTISTHTHNFESASHPATHPATIMVQDSSNRFVSDTEKSTWNAKVNTNDARLSDARTPVTHSHAAADITGTAVLTSDARLSDARTPTTHTHDYEPANANIQAHVTAAHAPSNAQKNSDIIKSEVEAVLTGEISTHTHAGGGLTQAQILTLQL